MFARIVLAAALLAAATGTLVQAQAAERTTGMACMTVRGQQRTNFGFEELGVVACQEPGSADENRRGNANALHRSQL